EQKKRKYFYDEISEHQKAEFINGEIIVQSPVKFIHDIISNNLNILLNTYVRKHNLGHVGHEKLLITLSRNDFEPDICFFQKKKSEKFQSNQTRFPAPDFIAEILSSGTEKIDRGVKFTDYAEHGVMEYWIIDPEKKTIEQYLLKKNTYELCLKINSGTIKSKIIKGFKIPVISVFDEKENISVLETLFK
ncbi:MAG: Uma2 family endonuclease, partial [Bacteroidetes bacterium]|nr:Uma2 family endonuclease [Bacteroidota bacterium]